MSEVLFFSLQFKCAQCHTWVTKQIAKHKRNAKYILHNIYQMSLKAYLRAKCLNQANIFAQIQSLWYWIISLAHAISLLLLLFFIFFIFFFFFFFLNKRFVCLLSDF